MFIFPVTERHQERVLTDEELNAYEGMPELGDGDSDGDDDVGLPTDADSDADKTTSRGRRAICGGGGTYDGVDTRGFGWEAFDGRGPTWGRSSV